MTGGRTKPWLILAETDNYGIQPYVMKLFDTINLEARDHVTAEVLGHVLAGEFDFNVPEAAFIEIGEDFLATINDDELLSTIEHKDTRLKFATALVDGNHLFSAGLPKRDVEKVLDIQTLFAFDNFIRNRDRNNNKPNMLIKADELFLIDHEMGLELNSKTLRDFNDGIWESRFMEYHVCYEYLTRASNRAKAGYFETFGEYLRNLNLNKLSSYFKQLNDLGFSTDRHPLIREYMEEIKNNSTKFVNLLKSGFDEEIF
jgi:hypothetical protein